MEPKLESQRRRESRKLTKDKKPVRAFSMQYPDRLMEGDDAHEDVAMMKGYPSQPVNQSVFSLITKAGSTTDFHKRFDEESSDSEEESIEKTSTSDDNVQNVREAAESANDFIGLHDQSTLPPTETYQGSQKPLQLDTHTTGHDEMISRSMFLPPQQAYPVSDGLVESSPPGSSTMDQVKEALAELKPSTVPTDTMGALSIKVRKEGNGESVEDLAGQLKNIFGFKDQEDVIAEYPCWLTQNVLLQGYMYITQYHICFYAYAPKRYNIVVKSGHLSKRGKQNPKYSRYWFQLKGDELSYRTDPSDPYFRSGNIDLRYGISANLHEPKEKNKGGCKDFSIVTPHREYLLKADSVASAKEWVKQLQRVIFRSHNKGDSVKISMPIENVVDIEEAPVMDVAETIKVRVADADEGFAVFAVDEVPNEQIFSRSLLTLIQYFFTFFGNGKVALKTLQSLVEDTAAQKIPENLLVASPAGEESRSRDHSQVAPSRRPHDFQANSTADPGAPVLREPVRATLSAYSPLTSVSASPRQSGEWGRNSVNIDRKSFDISRRSIDVGKKGSDMSGRNFRRAFSERRTRSVSQKRKKVDRQRVTSQTPSSLAQASNESLADPESDLGGSGARHEVSGSQILERSDVFKTPTMLRAQGSPNSPMDRGRKSSLDSPSANHGLEFAHIKIRPPTRSQTEQTVPDKPQLEWRNSQSSQSNTSPSLQQIVKAGGFPLQKAGRFADYLKTRSKRMSNLLASESMGYVEKVSGMLAGGRKHYIERDPTNQDEELNASDVEDNVDGSGDRFRAYFALPPSEKLRAVFFGYLHRGIPLFGKLYLSDLRLCFRSLMTKTKMVVPLRDIETVNKEKGFRFGYSGLVVIVRGHEELFFDFKSHDIRNDCAVTILRFLDRTKDLLDSGILTQQDKNDAEAAKSEHRFLLEARKSSLNDSNPSVAPDEDSSQAKVSILFDDPRASMLDFKPTESLRVTCLTIGSRGDVQPYIALCKALLKEGHKPRIATHVEFEGWIKKYGIDFAPVEGDPAELMRICVENGMFTYSFLKEASSKFRGWIDQLLSSAWKACQDTDLLIESPSAMAGSHIAEALKVPYFRAFTMPWTRTRAYPHAFAIPSHKKGGTYNELSYFLFDQVFWKAIAGQVNRWRKKELGLRSTDLTKLAPHRVPFLYNFSPTVVPPPLDFSDWIHVTGYWFLDEASEWSPPEDLVSFISKARDDEKKIVYIGFGSIVVSDPAALTKTVIESVLKADVRCILSKGWSDRLGNQNAILPEVPLPSEIFQIKSAPHDWLFRQIDAATHHGGAGTTGASLRAGLPTIVKPFFGDQYFFGSRIEDLGVGICLKKLNVSLFSRALWEATHSSRMIAKAKFLGEAIRNVSLALPGLKPVLIIPRRMAWRRQSKLYTATWSMQSLSSKIAES